MDSVFFCSLLCTSHHSNMHQSVRILHFCCWVFLSHKSLFTLNVADHNGRVLTVTQWKKNKTSWLFNGDRENIILPLLWLKSNVKIQQIKRTKIKLIRADMLKCCQVDDWSCENRTFRMLYVVETGIKVRITYEKWEFGLSFWYDID